MLALYLAIFDALCVFGIAMEVRAQLRQGVSDYLDIAHQTLKGMGAVGAGSAATALAIAIAVEGIMILAEFVKRRQLAQGIEIGMERGIERGIEQGIEQGMERGVKKGAKDAQERHAKIMREWAEENGIPVENLPKFDAPADSEDAAR